MGEIISLLAKSNYIILNKQLINKLGIKEAMVLSELCNEFDYWKGQDKLDDGYFYSTQENIKKNISIKSTTLTSVIKSLEKRKLIQIKRVGLPCKNYYKINEKELVNLLK